MPRTKEQLSEEILHGTKATLAAYERDRKKLREKMRILRHMYPEAKTAAIWYTLGVMDQALGE